MQDPDPLWYDREEPPYSWKETWLDLATMAAGAVTACVLFFSSKMIWQELSV